MNILIVEDEVRLADALGQIMEEQHYHTDIVYTGTDGLYCGLSGEYDVIVLDVMLPGENGFDVVKKLRKAHVQTPVLMLTARDDISDKVTGLDRGADDYMTKPFIPEELLARIRALSRRQGEVVVEELHFGDLTLNLSTNDLVRGRKSIHLGYKEFEVLKLLMNNAGTVEVTHTANTEFDYSDSVLNCVLLFESVAFENKVTLNNDIVPGIHICGSEPQIKQMVTILLDNACKYAGIHGTVSVSLKSSPHHAVLTVNNTGELIPPSDQKHIFERFYRTDKSRVRKEGGYGLGLSIARTIVEQHKGKITVSSSLEEGTTFTVMFPVP